MDQYKITSILPEVLENLIVEFCYYPIRSVGAINSFAIICWLHSRNLPTPRSWKHLLHRNDQFHWKRFLSTSMCPGCASTLISLAEVRHTVRTLNWHVVKNTHTTAAKFTIFQTKKSILKQLQNWEVRTTAFIFLIQRLLCSLDFPRCLNKTDTLNFDGCIISNPNPLCMYLKPPGNYL